MEKRGWGIFRGSRCFRFFNFRIKITLRWRYLEFIYFFFFLETPKKPFYFGGKNQLPWGTSKRIYFCFFFQNLPRSPSILEEKIISHEVSPKEYHFFFRTLSKRPSMFPLRKTSTSLKYLQKNISFFRTLSKSPSMFEKKITSLEISPKDFFFGFSRDPLFILEEKLQPLKKILTPLRYLQKISFFKPLPKSPSILEETLTSFEVSPKKILFFLEETPQGKNYLHWGISKRISFVFRETLQKPFYFRGKNYNILEKIHFLKVPPKQFIFFSEHFQKAVLF